MGNVHCQVEEGHEEERLLTKKASRLRVLDTAILRASVVTLVDQQASYHVDFYEGRRTTWEHWKSSTAMDHLVSSLLAEFYDLLENRTVGGQRFAQFLHGIVVQFRGYHCR